MLAATRLWPSAATEDTRNISTAAHVSSDRGELYLYSTTCSTRQRAVCSAGECELLVKPVT
jgi:hypothetical protein